MSHLHVVRWIQEYNSFLLNVILVRVTRLMRLGEESSTLLSEGKQFRQVKNVNPVNHVIQDCIRYNRSRPPPTAGTRA